MRGILLFFALIIGGFLLFHQALQDGSFLRYLDEHPQTKGVPEATYLVGQSYYLFQDLQEAATYFIRVAQRYPDQPLGDDAYFTYLRCHEDAVTVNRAELIEGYKAYLEKYPHGHHVEVVQNSLDAYMTGAR